MRILIVAKVLFSAGQTNGVRAEIEVLIPALTARGHAVQAIVLDPGAPEGRLTPVAETPALPLWATREPEAAFRAFIGRSRTDAVFILGREVLPIARIALRRALPGAVHVTDAELEWGLAGLAGEDRMAMLAITPFIARRMASALGLRATVLPTPIDPALFGVETTRRTALFINPVPHKGVQRALDLARARPQIPFVFAEAWPAPEEMRRRFLAAALALPNVTWSPMLRDPRPLYGEAKLLLAPSLWEEAGGRVVVEAQLSGIPVLASSRGGLPEMVGPGGLTVDVDAPLADWLAAFDALWSDEAAYRRYAIAARDHAEATVATPAAVAAMLEAALVGVARGPAGAGEPAGRAP